jgi:hypothetical protein
MPNYHVNYITGSDGTGDGSVGSPWASIQHALTTATPGAGDIIKVFGSEAVSVDTGATLASPSLTDTFNTSVDLTSQFTAGDIIMMSPNIPGAPEYDGWIQYDVVSVSATQIVTRAKWQIPLQENLTFTLYKFNNVVPTISESWSGLGTGCEVICGYDENFTTVTGYTQFVNTNVSAGSSSGTCFNTGQSGTGNFSNMPYCQNMSFSRYSDTLQAGFGVSILCNNIKIYAGKAANSYGIFTSGGNTTATKVYLNDAQSEIMAGAGYYTSGQNVLLNGTVDIDLKVTQLRDRELKADCAIFNELTCMATRGGAFGSAAVFGSSGGPCRINGPLTVVAVNQSDKGSAYAGSLVINYTGGMFYPTSIKVVDQGDTGAFWNFIGQASSRIPSIIKIPTGSITQYKYGGAGGYSDAGINAGVTVIDEDGTIRTGPNSHALLGSNTTEKETGDSCLEMLGQYSGVTTKNYIPALSAPLKNGGLWLTGFEVRAKKANTASTRLRINFGTPGYNPTDSTFMQLTQTISSTSYGTYSFALSANQQQVLKINADNSDIICLMSVDTVNPPSVIPTIYIDSITPIYA